MMIRKIRKGEPMGTIRVKRMGLAAGVTAAIVYLGCALVMAVVGRDGVILFLNSLFHGLDVSALIRINVSWWETLIGAVEVFILAWLSGAAVASIYNLGAKKGRTRAK
jgi:uncharacterized membrane protein